MHEMALTGAIVDIVLRQAQACDAQRVLKVNLVVGELRDVVESMMGDCFRHFAQGTVAEGAALEITCVPVRVRCKECDTEFGSSPERGIRGMTCPSCGRESFELLAGREFYVEDIEII